ncbi:Splicing factor YJU2 [Plasmodiophora brassicae]|uniref:Splicing factor YJU2 n=1 Tax=Plasmodiophora brassicae TaxID=37360 RepID=A0A0G4IJ61_PLABS|nr:hypothetical protein PBRA_003881 [Plasmodiophora brassicae]SPQ96434.1 unnamed protein product [Plasmodiophora brassicae]
MGERKVLNKYYPPDFDWTKLPRNRKPIDRQETVRTMLPMNVQCMSCGEFMYAGKKFNAKKELAIGEDYLTIKVYRFYIKCVMCSAQITFKTDPKNGSYVCESGAKRNFEPWREDAQEKEQAELVQEEEADDVMKALETRQQESKREMEQLEALESLKALSARHSQRTAEELLLAHQRKFQSTMDVLEAEDEEEVRQLFHSSDAPRICRRRIDDEDDDADGDREVGSNPFAEPAAATAADKEPSSTPQDPIAVVRRPVKRRRGVPDQGKSAPAGLLAASYGSDSD